MNRKIKSFKQVVKITQALKEKGKKIVFVHGVFDILHRGHVTLMFVLAHGFYDESISKTIERLGWG